MKRLLGLTGLVCFAVLTACFYLGDTWAVAFGILGFLLFLISMLIPAIRREGTYPLAFLTILSASAVFLIFTHISVLPVQTEFDGVTAQVKAVQKDEVYYSYGYYTYELETISIDGKEISTGVLLRTEEHLNSEPYDEISFTATLFASDNKGQLSKGFYLKSYLFDISDVMVSSPEKKPLMYHIISLRAELRRAIYLEMDSDTADFSTALLLGDKYAIDAEVQELLRMCGLSHISVVSGLHLSIITGISMKLFSVIFRKNRYLSALFSIFVIIGFALLTGLGIPVIRSAVMLIILIAGKLIRRDADSMNSIGAAALFICLLNPYAAGDVGMILSFCATIGIVLWCSKIARFVMSKLSKLRVMDNSKVSSAVSFIVYTLSCSLSAFIWTLPVGILVFGGFSTVTLLANLLSVPLLTFVLVIVIACAVLHFIPYISILADTCGFFAALYYEYLISVCCMLSSLPNAYIYTDKPYFFYWLGCTLILVGIALIISKKEFNTLIVLLSVATLLLGSALYNIQSEKILTLQIPDTGRDLSVVLQSSDGHAVVCCGGSNTKAYVLSDLISTLPHGDADVLAVTPRSYSDLYSKKLQREFDYPYVLRYDNIDEEDFSCKDKDILFSDDFELSLWDKATVKYITCDDAVFEYITAGDTEILILPRKGNCAYLDAQYLSPDVIVAERIIENFNLLSAETLIVQGNSYMSEASAHIGAYVANQVILGNDIEYEIRLN